MKYINIVFLVVLFSALAACGGAESRKEKYLQSGIKYLQDNSLQKARLEFRNVLQIDPKYPQGYFYMGQVNEKLKEYKKALGNYNKAIELKADYVEALTGAARIYLIANMSDKALELTEKVLHVSETNIDAIAVRAGVFYKAGEKDRALRDLEKNLLVDPDHLASLSLISRIYLMSHQVKKVEKLLSASLLRNPKNINVIILLVQLYSDDKQYEKATSNMEKLIVLKPDELSYRLRLAYYLDLSGEKDQALFTLRKAVQDFEDSMPARSNLTQYTAEKISIEKAQQTLAAYIKSDEDNPQLKLISATLYIKSDENEKAEAIYREIARVYGNEVAAVTAQYDLVRLLLRVKRKAEAKEVLAALLKSEPTHNEGLTLRGILSLEDKHAARAIADFRSVLKDQLASAKHMWLLAQAYLLDAQFELAQEQLKNLLQIEPQNVTARMALAKMYHQDKQFDDVLEQVSIVQQIQPENIQAKDLKFKAFLSLRDYAQAAQLAQAIEKQYPENVMGYFYYGLVQQAQNQLSASMQSYNKALQVVPNAAEPLGAYVQVALAMNKPELAKEKLRAVLQQQTNHVVAQNLLGEVLLKQGKTTAAASEFLKATKMAKAWWLPYRNLANAQLKLKQTDKAPSTYRNGYETAQKPERLLVLQANLLVQLKRADEAIALYEKHLITQPDSRIAINNLAVLLVEYRDDQASKARAMSLVESFKNSQNASYVDTLGWVYYNQGEYEKAIDALLKADKIQPGQGLIYYHLGKSYLDKGDTSSARKYLQKVANSAVDFKGKQDAKRILLSLKKA